MNRDECFEIFCKEFKRLQSVSNTDGMHKKHKSAKFSFCKFYPIVSKMKEMGYQTGIDFGCGNCSTIILGKILGVNVEGVDIPEYKKMVNFYNSLQNTCIKEGYKIHFVDSENFPFIENSIDFVLSYLSINEDYSKNDKVNHMHPRATKFISRMEKLLKFIRPKGMMYVGPIKKYNAMKDCIAASDSLQTLISLKKIKIQLWTERKYDL